VACIAAAALALPSSAQCPAQPWQQMGNVPGVFGTVYSLVEWDPDGPGPSPSLLVVGGDIQAAGSRTVNNLATWDGQAWSTLGIGLPRQSSSSVVAVSSLLVHDGQLIACGYALAGTNGQALGPVVRWTGTDWQTLGQVEGSGGAMIEFNGGIAAAVSTYTGSAWSPSVVWWNGASWQTLGTFDNGTPWNSIYGLAAENGNLIVAGNFTTANGAPSNGLARWTGLAWEDMGLPVGAVCFAVAATGTDMVVSDVIPSGSSHVYQLLRRDGGAWISLPSPFGSLEQGRGNVMTISGDIYVTDYGPGGVGGGGAYSGVARLVGSGWEPLGTDLPGVQALTQFRGQFVAGGVMTENGGRAISGVAQWSGSSWEPLAQGLSPVDFGPVITTSGAEIYASNVRTGDHDGSAVVKWNGHDWDWVLSASTRRLEVYQGDLILSANSPASGLLRYNGSTVEPIGPASQGWSIPYVLGGRLYSIPEVWSNPATVFRLDETGWTQLGPSFAFSIDSLDMVDGDLYMLGLRDAESGIDMVARWDGASWVNVGSWQLDSLWPLMVFSVVRFNGQLIACGQFFPYNNAFAVLSGDQWQMWPSPFIAARSPVVMGGELVVDAWPADNADENVIAKFDGSTWRTLGTVNATSGGGVLDMQALGRGVVIAGRFASIDGRVSHMFAKLDSIRCCGSADFNHDGESGTDADIAAFFACIAGNCCSACGSADFNDDGDVATDADIEAFFRVLAGGSC
jgi:hypothetical protein